jgi:hypothetical protein
MSKDVPTILYKKMRFLPFKIKKTIGLNNPANC